MLRKLLTAISLLSIATLVRAQVPTTPPKPTLIKAGRILDVRTGRYLAGQGILVENGKIKEVAALLHSPTYRLIYRRTRSPSISVRALCSLG